MFVSSDNVEGIDYVERRFDASFPVFVVRSIKLLMAPCFHWYQVSSSNFDDCMTYDVGGKLRKSRKSSSIQGNTLIVWIRSLFFDKILSSMRERYDEVAKRAHNLSMGMICRCDGCLVKI